MKNLRVKNCVIGFFTGSGIAAWTIFGLEVCKAVIDELRNLEKTKK